MAIADDVVIDYTNKTLDITLDAQLVNDGDSFLFIYSGNVWMRWRESGANYSKQITV